MFVEWRTTRSELEHDGRMTLGQFCNKFEEVVGREGVDDSSGMASSRGQAKDLVSGGFESFSKALLSCRFAFW